MNISKWLVYFREMTTFKSKSEVRLRLGNKNK